MDCSLRDDKGPRDGTDSYRNEKEDIPHPSSLIPHPSTPLAYMIYTSGSTGKPKGCMITHENLCNQLEGQQAIAPAPIGAMLLTCSISFDVSVLTIFWTLLQGATLVLPRQGEEKDPAKMADIIHKNRVTHSLTLPSPYTLLLDQAPPEKLQSLRLVNVSGEVCPTSLARKHERLLPNCQLYNLYGPTEAAVNCTFFTFPKGFSEPKVPIGIPIRNYVIFILDEKMQPVQEGEVGEIYIGGSKPVVGCGYWNRLELTAERFVAPPPHLAGSVSPQSKLYKTGDLARWMSDGNIEFLGRADFQVKYRGFRIELGEIETAIGQHPDVKETVVLLINNEEINDQQLLAYTVLNEGKTLSIHALRRFLEKTLPEYMLPSHLVLLDEMPLTTNGKFDRQALPAPTADRPDLGVPFEMPMPGLEQSIAGKWEKLLRLAPIGRHDKFFELGGNSILAARFIGEMMNDLNASIFITTIFDNPTIASYTAFLTKNYPEKCQALYEKAAIPSPAGKAPENRSSTKTVSQAAIAEFQSIVPRHLGERRSLQDDRVGDSKISGTKAQKPSPLFILAPPRSGTTLLRVMLAGHPGLFACNELQLLHFETLKERSAAYSGKFSLWSEGLVRAVMELINIGADDAKQLLDQFAGQGMTTKEMFDTLHDWLNSQPTPPDGQPIRIVDKSPSYALDPLALEKALTDFPDARFIHLVRHPYSMVRSFEEYGIGQALYLHEHSHSPRQLGELVWLQSHRNIIDFLKKVPGDRHCRIVYEDLVKAPDKIMRSTCEALGIPFHENLLDPYRDLDKKMTNGIYRESRSMGDTHFDQKKKIDPQKADDWKGVLTDNFLCDETWQVAQALGYRHPDAVAPKKQEPLDQQKKQPSQDIAIIGMACRLPGANSIEAFWQNLVTGKDVSRPVTDADLAAEGLTAHPTSNPALRVHRTYSLDDPYAFDATFFGYHPKEAELTDPQHRIFLETAYQALESAGYDPYRFGGNIGIFGGVARNTYFTNNLLTNKELMENAGGWYQEMLASDPTFSISRVAYKLNLRGPAVNVQTACSTGGTAIHLACQSLLASDSDLVIVGGGRVQPPVTAGYDYIEGGPLSPDGVCRAFDQNANGMVQGHGMAMLVLKKLDKAIEDGDHVWAVIKSSAINNDGADKTGITAPSAKGQAAVIRSAIEKAGLAPDDIGYIEAHGTGTFIGDPIEMQGLMEVFGKKNKSNGIKTDVPRFIGSVKTNIGHLDAGAGIVGVIKAALSLYHEGIPPTLHFTAPNPQIDFENAPFEVNTELRPWKRGDVPRRAGVSSFGLGGTNAHIILEEAPQAPPASMPANLQPPQWTLNVLSAKTEKALDTSAANLKAFFENNPTIHPADAAYTLAIGRPHFSKRMAFLIPHPLSLIPHPSSLIPLPSSTPSAFHNAPIAFMFPGGGAQYVGMARDLYDTNSYFKKQVDTCIAILDKQHDIQIKDIVFPPSQVLDSQSQIEQPAIALAALFTMEYALAKLWMHWGIRPSVLIGHSMGEYTAACIAGVMRLEDALGLVTVRGRLFETLDGDGGMLSVALTEEQLQPYLDAGHTISVFNKPDSLVVSGTAAAIDRLQQRLDAEGIDSSNIRINVAAHSPQVEPILPAFGKYLETVELKSPQIPIVSNVTGTWLAPEQATSPEYWLRHLRQPVRFADGLKTLLDSTPDAGHSSSVKNRIFLEVGPGQVLSTFARAVPTLPGEDRLVLASVRHPKEQRNDVEFILKTLGKLWVNGVEVDWPAFYENDDRKRIPLQVYPFERRKYFIPPKPLAVGENTRSDAALQTALPKAIQVEAPLEEKKTEQTMRQTDTRQNILVKAIKQTLHELSGLEPENMDEDASFLELGFDSLFLSQAVIKFNHQFGLNLSFRMLFENLPTIAALAGYVDETLPPELFRPEPVKEVVPENKAPNTGALENIKFPEMTLPAGTEAPTTVQQVIQQQLLVMQQQLAYLQAIAQQPAPPPVPSSPSIEEGQAEPPPSLGGGRGEAPPRTKGVTAKLNSYKKISGGEDLSEQQRKSLADFMERYAAMTQKSKELAQRHRQWYADPRSVTGFSKLWKEICYQIAHERSKGSKIWDVDGNEYVDYVMSYGVALFGHLPDFVAEAVAAALQRGNSIDLLPPEATDVARIICELTGYDRATLANTGTEAVLGAVRAARTATGREKIAVFDTDYHGMIDQFMVRGVSMKGENKTLPSSPGVPQFLVENTLVLDYDDPDVLQKLERHVHELAAVVIEPVQAQNPHWQHRELIQAIRRLTEQHGTALIFDEIINGFRLHQRGAQAWYGVEADISAYGKSISGGLPLAAIAGKARFMEAFDGGQWSYGDDSSPEGVIAYFASTFIKNPLSVAAAYSAMKEIERLGPGLQGDLNEKTIRFAERIREIFLRTQAPLMIQSCSSFFMIKNADSNPLTRLFNYFLRARGVNIRERPCFISTAHTEADFEKTYRAFEDAINDMFAAGLMEPWEGEDMNMIVYGPTMQGSETTPASGEPIHVPITEGQQEIFLSDQISKEASKAYNIATEIRLEGFFDPDKMRRALQALVDRHEALRTVINEDGLTQTILPYQKVEIPFVDLSGESDPDAALRQLHDEEAEHLFDLQCGPLVRFKIVRLAQRSHLVLINVHHIICDGWSLGILTRELGALYAGNKLPEPGKQLGQFATEQAELQQLEVFQKNENYWLAQFADRVPVLDLPMDFQRPAVKTFAGAVERISLDPGFVKTLRSTAARQGSTLYVFMLAAFNAYISRLSGQSDFVVGVAAAGHNLPGNAQLVAHAIGLLPVRTSMEADSTFVAYLKTVRKQVLDAFDHQQYTFGSLVKKLKITRSSDRNTLVSVAFNLDSPLDDLQFGGLAASTRAIPRHYETFDTFINLKPVGDRVDFEWNFNTNLFRPESVRLRLAEFKTFLQGVVEEMETPVARLPLLPDFECKQLASFGQGVQADFPLHRCLHGLFEEQAALTPDKMAVVMDDGSSTLTYGELNLQSNKLASTLIETGLRPGAFVGLCMERSPEMLVCTYAILKAGGAYVPIDPRNPQERIQFILEDAACSHLLTHSAVMANLPVFQGEILIVDSLDLGYKIQNNVAPALTVPSHAPAYVIYTSGSTGMPKGVAISHKNVVNTLFAINEHLNISERDTVFSVSSMAFDMSVPDYFLTLMTGATLVLAGEETKKDGFALRESLENLRPTVMQATPTTWRILMLAGWEGDPNLTAVAGGEGFPKDLAGEMAACCKAVWNGYGPTETTIYTTYQRITAEHLAACPGEFAAIGKPIANVVTLILDKNGEPAPIGVPGELFIGGPGVAGGYLNRPELSAEKFTSVSQPSDSIAPSEKWYKTGDLVRCLPGGEIEFLGRMDDQVKIRGYRVELGEIEEVMKQYPGVANAAVTVLNDPTGSQRLAAYLVWENGTGSEEGLNHFLRSKLPGFMVPHILVKMDQLPMNTSLKIDRKALPLPDMTGHHAGEFMPPQTPGEKLLANVWQELLGVKRVGIHDDFFELGGHSLAAVQMMSKIKDETGVRLPLTTLFQNATVKKLAVQLNGFNKKNESAGGNGQIAGSEEGASLIPIREGGAKPPLYLVHGGGLHVLFYQNLVKYLDEDQPIYALQAKGLDGSEEPLDRIEDMAAHYIREMLLRNPDGPFCLAGYSLGGLIAWEMAKQLKDMGKEVPMLSLFDAVAKYEWAGEGAGGKWNKRLKKAGFNLSLMLKDPAAALEYKKHVLKMNLQHQKGKILMAYRNNRTNEIEEGYLPYGKEVFEKSMEAYRKYELQPLDIQVDLFKAKEQMFYLHDPVHYGWDRFALRGVLVHEIEGNHLTLFDDPHGRQVAAVLRERLAEVVQVVR